MKVAIFARYSSDNQRDASIADQFRMCRLHAEKQGWTIVEEYSDHAISGASLLRLDGCGRTHRQARAVLRDAGLVGFRVVVGERVFGRSERP
ncbi:MAG: recombinase family protein, partial [Pseudolabrys sp.]